MDVQYGLKMAHIVCTKYPSRNCWKMSKKVQYNFIGWNSIGLVLYSSKIQSLQFQCSDSMHRSIEQFVSMYINLGYNFVG